MVVGLVGIIGTLFLDLNVAATLCNFGTFTSFIIVCVAVLILRRIDPDRERPFRRCGGRSRGKRCPRRDDPLERYPISIPPAGVCPDPPRLPILRRQGAASADRFRGPDGK